MLAWPYRGKPGKVSISQESPDRDTWVRAQVTFKNVDRDFLLMFRARVSGKLVTSAPPGRCLDIRIPGSETEKNVE